MKMKRAINKNKKTGERGESAHKKATQEVYFPISI